MRPPDPAPTAVYSAGPGGETTLELRPRRWFRDPRWWLIFGSVFTGGLVILALAYFVWFQPMYGDIHRLVVKPPAPTITPAPTTAPTTEPEPTTDDPTPDPTTPDDTASPTGDPTTATPSPTPIVHWTPVNLKRACGTVDGTPTSTAATSITCTVSTTTTKPVGTGDTNAVAAAVAQAASKAGQHECDTAPAVFQDPKTWYCQPADDPIIPVNWEGICGPGAYRTIDTTHPACIVTQTRAIKLKVGGQLNKYCQDHGYTTSASGQSSGAPSRLSRPYCKRQS